MSMQHKYWNTITTQLFPPVHVFHIFLELIAIWLTPVQVRSPRGERGDEAHNVLLPRGYACTSRPIEFDSPSSKNKIRIAFCTHSFTQIPSVTTNCSFPNVCTRRVHHPTRFRPNFHRREPENFFRVSGHPRNENYLGTGFLLPTRPDPWNSFAGPDISNTIDTRSG